MLASEVTFLGMQGKEERHFPARFRFFTRTKRGFRSQLKKNVIRIKSDEREGNEYKKGSSLHLCLSFVKIRPLTKNGNLSIPLFFHPFIVVPKTSASVLRSSTI